MTERSRFKKKKKKDYQSHKASGPGDRDEAFGNDSAGHSLAPTWVLSSHTLMISLLSDKQMASLPGSPGGKGLLGKLHETLQDQRRNRDPDAVLTFPACKMWTGGWTL